MLDLNKAAAKLNALITGEDTHVARKTYIKNRGLRGLRRITIDCSTDHNTNTLHYKTSNTKLSSKANTFKRQVRLDRFGGDGLNMATKTASVGNNIVYQSIKEALNPTADPPQIPEGSADAKTIPIDVLEQIHAAKWIENPWADPVKDLEKYKLFCRVLSGLLKQAPRYDVNEPRLPGSEPLSDTNNLNRFAALKRVVHDKYRVSKYIHGYVSGSSYFQSSSYKIRGLNADRTEIDRIYLNKYLNDAFKKFISIIIIAYAKQDTEDTNDDIERKSTTNPSTTIQPANRKP